MKWPQIKQFNLEERTILAGYVGSLAHGTYIPNYIDDIDVMGICVPPLKFYYGLQKYEQCATWVENYDITVYEIQKFFRLLLKNNPNVLGLLWLPDTGYIKKTNSGNDLIENRNLFVSKLAYKSFTGYAYSQLKKMTAFKFEGYMGEKRKELVNKFGYDCKNASHLIRLLRMGIEYLVSGEVNVYRHDSAQLVEIKQGHFELAKIQEMAEDLFKKAEDAYIRSTLPNVPNYVEAEKLLIHILQEANKDENN